MNAAVTMFTTTTQTTTRIASIARIGQALDQMALLICYCLSLIV
jgi:hypothetical protein